MPWIPVTTIGSLGPPPPDLRRRAGRSNYTGPLDPVMTEAAQSGSIPTMTTRTVAGSVTIELDLWIILSWLLYSRYSDRLSLAEWQEDFLQRRITHLRSKRHQLWQKLFEYVGWDWIQRQDFDGAELARRPFRRSQLHISRTLRTTPQVVPGKILVMRRRLLD